MSLATTVLGVVIVKTAPPATQQLVFVLLVDVNLDGPEVVVIHVMHLFIFIFMACPIHNTHDPFYSMLKYMDAAYPVKAYGYIRRTDFPIPM